MQIVCPACDTRYEVPDARLAPGKRVRCARCGDGWIPIPPSVELMPTDPLPPDPLPPEPPAPAATSSRIFAPAASLPEPAPPPRSPDRFVRLGWLATALLIAAALLLARSYRGQIEHAWPPSMRLYNLF